jgi:hypothetical protein
MGVSDAVSFYRSPAFLSFCTDCDDHQHVHFKKAKTSKTLQILSQNPTTSKSHLKDKFTL